MISFLSEIIIIGEIETRCAVPMLKRTMNKPIVIVGAVIVVVVGIFILVRVFATTTHLPPGKEIMRDDFGFTALSVEMRKQIGTAVPKQGDAFYIVDAKIVNHA